MSSAGQMTVQDVKPSSLSHIIGNKQARTKIQVALDACHQDGVRFPDALLTGPPGLGKSSLANVIASEMAAPFHETLGQSVSGRLELNTFLLCGDDGDVLHIDEVHELKNEQQTTLFMCLDQRVIPVVNQRGRHDIPVRNFTLLLSTTDPHKVLQPLRDRMRLTIDLAYLTVDELSEVVRTRAEALGWALAPELPAMIAECGRNTPRIALRLLESGWRVSRSRARDCISLDDFSEACRHDGIGELGLDQREQDYLKLLAEGPQRPSVLASTLGVPLETVRGVIEPYLTRMKLISLDSSGPRSLTASGYELAERFAYRTQGLPDC